MFALTRRVAQAGGGERRSGGETYQNRRRGWHNAAGMASTRIIINAA